MSLKRPTVDWLAFILSRTWKFPLQWIKFMSYWNIKFWNISPLCDVAQTSDCGTLVIYFQYKPFMWCRLDVWLWHSCHLLSIQALYVMLLRRPTVALLSFTFNTSPLCDVASDVRLWHALLLIFFHYKPFMWCRLDARLRHRYFICILSRSHSDTRLAVSITLGFREDYHPTSLLFSHALLSLCLSAIVNLFICIMFTFVISYVQTVLRVLS